MCFINVGLQVLGSVWQTLRYCDDPYGRHYAIVMIHMAAITPLWRSIWQTLCHCDDPYGRHYAIVMIHMVDIRPLWRSIWQTLRHCDDPYGRHYAIVTIHMADITMLWLNRSSSWLKLQHCRLTQECWEVGVCCILAVVNSVKMHVRGISYHVCNGTPYSATDSRLTVI